MQIAVTAQRAIDFHFILLHVTADFHLRYVHLPATAVQAAVSFDQAIELRRPVRRQLHGVDAMQRQLAAPADRLLPVEQRGQLRFAFQRRDGELVEVHLPLVAFGVESDVRRRHVLPFHRGAERQGVVGHLTAELQLQVIGLELFLAGKRPVELLAVHLKVERQPGFRQLRLRANTHIHRAGKVNPHFQLLAHRAAHLQLHLFALQRVDIQGAVEREVYRPVVDQRRGTAGVHRALAGVDIQRVELHVAVDTADLQQHLIHRQVGIAGNTQLLAAKGFDIQIQRQMHIGHLRQHRFREQLGHGFAERFFLRLRVIYLRLHHLFLRHVGDFRQSDEQALQRRWRQRQVLFLPRQAAAEVHHRHRGVINLDIDVVEREPLQSDWIRRREIQRPAVLFLHRRGRRHFAAVDCHVDVAERDIVNAHAAVPRAIELHRQMKFTGIHRHARLGVADVFQR